MPIIRLKMNSIRKECDFIVFEREKPIYEIQVCFDLSQNAIRK
jgi:hypothetical protein